MGQPATPVPAGWYPDPANPAAVRWWDGGRWTEHVHPVQPWPAAAWQPAKATTTPDGVPLAGLGARLLARTVDSLLLGVLQLAAAVPFLPGVLERLVDYVDTHQQELDAGTFDPFELYLQTGILQLFLVFLVASVALSAVYTVTFVRFRGATPGKMLAGVRVRSWQSEGRPTWAQSAQRWMTGELAGTVVSLYSLVDGLWPCWDDRRQALHDKCPAPSWSPIAPEPFTGGALIVEG